MKKIAVFALFFILFSNNAVFCQQSTADSIIAALGQLSGEKKVDALNQVSDLYNNINCKVAIDYAQKAVDLAASINYTKGIAAGYGCMGFSYINIDKQKAIYYTQKALDIRRNIQDKPGIGRSLNVLGIINYFMGDYVTSIDYHLQALKIREEIGNYYQIYSSYNNISIVYLALEDYNTALAYLQKALDMTLKAGKSPAIVYDNMGDIYSRTGKYDLAFKYFDKSLALHKKNGNKKSEANCYMLKAVTFKRLQDTSNALINYRIAEDIYAGMDEKNGLAQSQNGIAEIYKIRNLMKPSIEYALKALKNASQIHSLEKISIAAEILHDCYRQSGDNSKAYDYLLLFHNTRDSLQSVDKFKKLTRVEFENKIKRIEQEQELKLARQRVFNISFTITTVLLLIIVLLVIREYRNKKALNIKLSSLNSKLQELIGSKDRFFSIIAHDLRGPFQGLLGVSEMLSAQAGDMKPDEIQDFSLGLHQALQKQYRLLNDLLDWSKLQDGNFRLSLEQLKLRNELCTVMESSAYSAARKEILLVNDVDENIEVPADKNMIHLVLRNIIANGVKFTPKGGTVKVSAADKGDTLELIVEDSGVGISESNIQKLFRIDIHHTTNGTQNEPGSGFGLILCKEIIDKHAGEIRVESKLSQGSKFIITLPKTAGL